MVLNLLLWGSGHYFLGYRKLGLILIAVEAYFILTFQPSWIYIVLYLVCTAVICYDSYRKTSALRKPLHVKEKLAYLQDIIRILDYKIIITVGLFVLLIGYILINLTLTYTGTLILIVGFALRLKKAKK